MRILKFLDIDEKDYLYVDADSINAVFKDEAVDGKTKIVLNNGRSITTEIDHIEIGERWMGTKG